MEKKFKYDFSSGVITLVVVFGLMYLGAYFDRNFARVETVKQLASNKQTIDLAGGYIDMPSKGVSYDSVK